LVLSGRPFEGERVVDILGMILRRWHLWTQIVVTNLGPLNNLIVIWSPWRCTTTCIDNSANPESAILVWLGMKCHIFECQSAITQNASNHSHCGYPPISSTQISTHDWLGVREPQRSHIAKSGILDQCWNFIHTNGYLFPVHSSNNLLRQTWMPTLVLDVNATLCRDVTESLMNAVCSSPVCTGSPVQYAPIFNIHWVSVFTVNLAFIVIASSILADDEMVTYTSVIQSDIEA